MRDSAKRRRVRNTDERDEKACEFVADVRLEDIPADLIEQAKGLFWTTSATV